jgi:hypothetical protein
MDACRRYSAPELVPIVLQAHEQHARAFENMLPRQRPAGGQRHELQQAKRRFARCSRRQETGQELPAELVAEQPFARRRQTGIVSRVPFLERIRFFRDRNGDFRGLVIRLTVRAFRNAIIRRRLVIRRFIGHGRASRSKASSTGLGLSIFVSRACEGVEHLADGAPAIREYGRCFRSEQRGKMRRPLIGK